MYEADRLTLLWDFIRRRRPDPYGERRTALRVEHYRNLAGRLPNPLERLMEMFPMTVHQVKVAKRLLADGLVYTEEQALKAGELIVQGRRKAQISAPLRPRPTSPLASALTSDPCQRSLTPLHACQEL